MSFFGATDPIQRYREAFPQRWRPETPAAEVRFVALDLETTGLDARKDLIVSIGAVAIMDGEIRLEDQFEALLKVPYNTSTVVVHGVTREASLQGMEETEALRTFLGYLEDAVIVGHHIGFDVEILRTRCRLRFGVEIGNAWIDTQHMAMFLEKQGGIAPLPPDSGRPDFSLDELCRRLGVAPHDRHTASGDAFMSAQIFIKLLRFGRNHGLATLGGLMKCGEYE